MPKHESFANFLKNSSDYNYKGTFEDIEKILGEKLPLTAFDDIRFWSNRGMYSLMREVVKAGWKQTKINIHTREVEFEKANLTDFQKLQSYILNKMKPQANYQLVMIMTLVRMGGSLTKDILAEQIKLNNPDNPDQDYKQIPVYEVLTKNEIVRQEGIHYVLNGYYDFTDEQKRKIVELCEQKIKEFSSKNIEENLDEVLESNKDNDITKKFIDNRDFAKFLNAVPMISPFKSNTGRPSTSAENYQILYRILYGTALKLDDALNLKVRDLDLDNRQISAVDSKGNRYVATILPCDVSHLKQHIEKLEKTDSLIEVNRQNVWSYAQRIAIRAGLIISVTRGKTTREGVSPSLFRNSRGIQMKHDGADNDLIDLKLHKKNKNKEYRDTPPPTIEELKKWESQHYPFDYSEVDSSLKHNVVSIDKTEHTEDFFDDKPLQLPTPESLEKTKKAIKEQILIDDEKIEQIISHLVSGKSILLTGPVGSGKTHLATILPQLAWEDIGGYCSNVYTATADWTTQDVIGGIYPKVDSEKNIIYDIQQGCVTETVSKNWLNGDSKTAKRIPYSEAESSNKFKGVWLVIDEFNRANIDRAFGQLFTALEYRHLQIPTTIEGKSFKDLIIPEDYRIIGTLNTSDKHFLHQLSDALKRRFAIIEITTPSFEQKNLELFYIVKKSSVNLDRIHTTIKVDDSKSEIVKGSDPETEKILETLYHLMIFLREIKPLGTALLISMFRFMVVNHTLTNNWQKSLDMALTSFVIPQLESLQYWTLKIIRAVYCQDVGQFFKNDLKIQKEDYENYTTDFESFVRFLKKVKPISGSILKRFRNDLLTEEDFASLNPWNEQLTRPSLPNFREAITTILEEKGIIEESDTENDS